MGGMEPEQWLSPAGMQGVVEVSTPTISLPDLSTSVCWFHPQCNSSSAFHSLLGVGRLNSLALTKHAWLCCRAW